MTEIKAAKKRLSKSMTKIEVLKKKLNIDIEKSGLTKKMFEELNKCVTKFKHVQEKIEDRNDKN